MFKAGAAALVAAMCTWCGTATAATVITDPAGDANHGGNAGLDVSTGPVSDAPRDLTKVVASSDGSALSLAFTTSAPVDQGVNDTFVRLNVTTPKCPIEMGVVIGGTKSDNTPAYLPLVDVFDCGGWFSSEGYDVTSRGSTLTVRFPYAALARDHVPITATTALTHLHASTFEGTMLVGGSGCSGDPTFCAVFDGTRYRAYVGSIVDKTVEAARFRR